MSGTAITSGSEATYTNIPDTDDEDDGVEFVNVDLPSSSTANPENRRKRPNKSSTDGDDCAKKPALEDNMSLEGSDPLAVSTSEAFMDRYKCAFCAFASESLIVLKNHHYNKHPKETFQTVVNDKLAFAKKSTSKPATTNTQNMIEHTVDTLMEASKSGVFKCAYCHFTSNLVNDIKDHHYSSHASEPYQSIVNNQVTITTNPQLTGVETIPVPIKDDNKFVFTCKYCQQRTETVKALYTHWQQMHKFGKGSDAKEASSSKTLVNLGKKFAFGIDLNVRCALCSHRISYRQMRGHFLRLHSDGPCACIHLNFPKQCALCGFRAADHELLMDHFADYHPLLSADDSTILDRPIVPINDEALQNMLLSGHRGTHKCLYCYTIFDFYEDYEEHHQTDHKQWPQLTEVTPAEIRFGCTICEFDAATEPEVVQHLQHHNLYKFQSKFQCLICPATFRTKSEIRSHHQTDHLSDARGWRLTALNTRMGLYNRMKVIFPNGLYLLKSELKATKWGNTEVIEAELNRLEADELKIEMCTPKHHKRRLVDGNESDETTSSRASKISKTSSPEKAEPTGFSYYGKPRDPVDLKNIFTTMQFGNSDIRIACDRFAMMVDIDPKLVLVPVRLSDHLCKN